MLSHVAESAFWLLVSLMAYVYVGYPLTLLLLLRHRASDLSKTAKLRATVLIPAYNESREIRRTVENKLAQTYQDHGMDVLVISDGSTDGMEALLKDLEGPRFRVVRQETRRGKTAALNFGMERSQGDIVVFSDANSYYDPSAVERMVSAFADPSVGYVTGRLVYQDPGTTAVGGGSGLYLRYENWVRTLETRVGSVVGVNGGIDAVRRELFQPMRPDQLPDFILPLRVVEQGYRVVYCPEAVSYENALGRQDDEFRMRVRVSLRALHALWDMRHLLHPRHGLFALQLLVHKVLRYLVVFAIAGGFLANALLVGEPFYRALFIAQCLFCSLALVGWLSGGRIKLRVVFVPFYFCLVNLAAGLAFIRFLRGERQVLWTPRKGA